MAHHGHYLTATCCQQYEFLTQYSADPNNTVIGIVRNKATTEKKLAEDPVLQGRSNIHILEADVTDYSALQRTVTETAAITGGSLDYIIANAAFLPLFDGYDPIGKLGEKPEELTKIMRELFETNVIANVHLFNLFLPLVLKGQAKKIIAISSGMSDPVFTNNYDITPGALYAASKAAMNLIVAKFSAQYKADGVLFLALCPGMVDTGLYKDGMLSLSLLGGGHFECFTDVSDSQQPRSRYRG